MQLRLIRKRYVPGLEPGATQPWFDGHSLEQTDVEQLGSIAVGWALRFPPDEAAHRVLKGGYEEHLEHFDELGTVPLEQWDVLGRDQQQYQLWLYGVDAGVLFRAGTTEVVGEMCQNHWDPYSRAPHGLGEVLESARLAAVEAAKRARAFPCSLASYRFART